MFDVHAARLVSLLARCWGGGGAWGGQGTIIKNPHMTGCHAAGQADKR